MSGHTTDVSVFDGVVDEYDAARPGYPEALFDALGPLEGTPVIEGGCGTGIATRRLIERGARVIGVEIGPKMLRRAIERSPQVLGLQADAARLPVSDHCADLLCFAQSWHWVDERVRVEEAHRVLQPGCKWAAWWSHARDDGEPWFDSYWDIIEGACPGTLRSQRDIDWAEDLAKSGLFSVDRPSIFPWVREIEIEAWLTDHRVRATSRRSTTTSGCAF
jgi:ubiquinone/menaquinone biosynthesis C-methylase UbiE